MVEGEWRRDRVRGEGGGGNGLVSEFTSLKNSWSGGGEGGGGVREGAFATSRERKVRSGMDKLNV